MNEIFAIDPDAPNDIRDIKAMFEQFGLSNGKFIANYPDDWLLLFKKHVQQLHGLDRSRLIRLLEKHKDALLNVEVDFRRAKSWLENANEAKLSKKSISRVLATEPNVLGVESLQKFLWEDDVDNSSRGSHIPMEPDAYSKAVAPLLSHSTEVHLADPFFQLRREGGGSHRGRFDVLHGFLQEAENSGRCEIFKIHFKRLDMSRIMQEKQIEDDLYDILDYAKIKHINIEFSLQDEMPHGRYFFSIKGGLQFDHGFEPLRNKTNHVHWLSKAELEPLYRKYL